MRDRPNPCSAQAVPGMAGLRAAPNRRTDGLPIDDLPIDPSCIARPARGRARAGRIVAALLSLPTAIALAAPANPKVTRPATPAATGSHTTSPAGSSASMASTPATGLPPIEALQIKETPRDLAAEGPALKVASLIELGQRESPLLAQERAALAQSQAGVVSALAWPNPALELLGGRSRSREAQGLSGSAPQVGVAQPIEWPALRGARQTLAQRRVETSEGSLQVTERAVVAAIRRAAVDLLRLEQEVAAAAEDVALTEQIRSRIALSNRAGEVPRFDLTRAEAEVAIARKVLESTLSRQAQARFELRRVVGAPLPEPFRVDPVAAVAPSLEARDFERLMVALEASNPELAFARSELARAQQEIVYERTQGLPQVTLRASAEIDPSATSTRIGAQVSVPIFDQRAGPIAQATAGAERARAQLQQRRLELVNGLESNWRAYLAAQAQLRALDSGIVARAREILNTAEAAYRYGERGILETLDAQRQFRAARLELIAARHTLALARIELERLTGL